LINIGAYVKGSNPGIDFAISKIDAINRFLRQNFDETASLKQSIEELGLILSERKDEDRQPKLNRRVSDKEH
jgi:flagellum-specific ATP synthase